MSLSLCYSALSPFCRKVRMAMDYKQLVFTLVETDRLEDLPVWNPRAEVPILIHGEAVICNSADILGYLDHCYANFRLYPAAPRNYAEVRSWERTADTQLDAIVAVIGNWQFANLPPMPPGLMNAARRDIGVIYDQLQLKLAGSEFICGEISAADFATYPHVASAAAVGLKFDAHQHADVQRWMRAMRARPEGQIDAAAAREWWAHRETKAVDTARINWGTFRLEWLLANGCVDWFAGQIKQNKVLWSTGPSNNALNSPSRPPWAR